MRQILQIAVALWLAALLEGRAGEMPMKAEVTDRKVAWILTCVDIHKSDSVVRRIVWGSHNSRQDISVKHYWLEFEPLSESDIAGVDGTVGIMSSRGGDLQGIKVPPGEKALIFDREMTKGEGGMPGIYKFEINGETCESSVTYTNISVVVGVMQADK